MKICSPQDACLLFVKTNALFVKTNAQCHRLRPIPKNWHNFFPGHSLRVKLLKGREMHNFLKLVEKNS
jgi:hypothetical protein